LIRSIYLSNNIHRPILVKDITIKTSALILGKAGWANVKPYWAK
jgi:hypothetical protein